MKVIQLINKFVPGVVMSIFVMGILYFIIGFTGPQVLGISNSVNAGALLTNINNARRSNGLSDLVINDRLSAAASQKASDMFAKNYWAHFSPTGTSPWYFISKNGYAYSYAGENLANGFTSSEATFGAWMASSAHRANILSRSYKETGFAVVDGNLQGRETVLVVEMFGSKR